MSSSWNYTRLADDCKKGLEPLGLCKTSMNESLLSPFLICFICRRLRRQTRQSVSGRVRVYQDALGIGITYIRVYALVYVFNALWSTTLYILSSPMARPEEEPRRGRSEWKRECRS